MICTRSSVRFFFIYAPAARSAAVKEQKELALLGYWTVLRPATLRLVNSLNVAGALLLCGHRAYAFGLLHSGSHFDTLIAY